MWKYVMLRDEMSSTRMKSAGKQYANHHVDEWSPSKKVENGRIEAELSQPVVHMHLGDSLRFDEARTQGVRQYLAARPDRLCDWPTDNTPFKI
mmetsp:Transcript_48644/g.120631  ORF Transcript_48644/g.120631 Transcript_48644/m.120631 type:complete len:93 (-) Transcript_48644:464-742(-)